MVRTSHKGKNAGSRKSKKLKVKLMVIILDFFTVWPRNLLIRSINELKAIIWQHPRNILIIICEALIERFTYILNIFISNIPNTSLCFILKTKFFRFSLQTKSGLMSSFQSEYHTKLHTYKELELVLFAGKIKGRNKLKKNDG